jgi:acetyl esterase/lipase
MTMRRILALALIVSACAQPTPAPEKPPVTAPEPPRPVSVPEASVKLMTWPDLMGRPKPEPTLHVSYGWRAQQRGTLWLPEGSGLAPVVLMIHGGCWQKSIADLSLMNWAAEDLRKRGFAVWNIEYRGVDEPEGGYPGTFEDVYAGTEKLRDLAPVYKLDLNRVVAFGHSAGGHLAMWVAARPNLPLGSKLRWDHGEPLKIRGVVNSGGLADLAASAPVTQADCLASIMDKLTGKPDGSRPNVLAETSPAEMLPLRVKQVSVNGANDRIAPPVLGEGWTKKAKAAGDDATVVIVPDTGHVELIAPGTAAFEAEAKIIAELTR